MSRLRSTAAAVLVCLALSGCDDAAEPTAGQTTGQTGEPPAVTSQKPRFEGPLGVRVQAGLQLVGEGCAQGRNRVCSVAGDASYAPVEEPTDATLVSARTRLAEGHTSWTVVIDLEAADRGALTGAARRAAAMGGVVLVMTRDRRVLVAGRATDVRDGTLRLTDLDKRTAWETVERFTGG